MAVKKEINETELRKAILQLHPDGELFEVRVIGGGKSKPISGYFKDVETLIKAFDTVDLRNTNVYITLNQLDEALFSRQQSEHFMAGANATGDNDVVGYQWFFVDMDPIRATGVSSSSEELKEAFELAKRVQTYLQNLGFEEPVKAVSGNGAHLLYRIQLGNTEENKTLVERCLKALSMLFDTDTIKIDTTNFNQSRVCKLYGTLAQKGRNTADRPHRMSRIIGEVKKTKVTDKVYLQKLSDELPKDAPKPNKYNNYNPGSFDIEEWMDQQGIRYKKSDYKDGVKYVLDECPFNPAHKAPDSMITKASSGAIGFKCLHNSCSGYHWQDLRLKYEPDAYDKTESDKRIEEGWRQHNRDKAKEQAERWSQGQIPTAPIFLTAEMIFNLAEPEGEYIKTGILEIDKRMKGLQKGCVSVVSGLRGAAKSTIISQIILNCIEEQHTTVCYSGELAKKKFMKWMYLQAAGKAYTKPYMAYDGYYCPDDIKPKINQWMSNYMWLYNNDYGNNFAKIGQILRAQIETVKADLCIVDNLMALDLTEFDNKDKYEAQTKFVWELKDIAQKCNVHIIFVAHPRKAQGFLRLDDVSGSGNITNIVDNAFIIHRNNEDFRRYSAQMFGWKASNPVYDGTNVIEVCKDRDGGLQDYFIPLWYEKETKRLKNYEAENIVYRWNKGNFVNIPEEEQEEIPW